MTMNIREQFKTGPGGAGPDYFGTRRHRCPSCMSPIELFIHEDCPDEMAERLIGVVACENCAELGRRRREVGDSIGRARAILKMKRAALVGWESRPRDAKAGAAVAKLGAEIDTLEAGLNEAVEIERELIAEIEATEGGGTR